MYAPLAAHLKQHNVAALFVEARGPYFGITGVKPFGFDADARGYMGPWPVVAHPPCARWGSYSNAQGRQTGDDNSCFVCALDAVWRWGGVLEHPAKSKAWVKYGLQKPSPRGWTAAGGAWVCEVEQGHYGHAARKPTWLYAKVKHPLELLWGPSRQRLPHKRLLERGYAASRRGGAVANQSHYQRQLTPFAFRDMLLAMASGFSEDVTVTAPKQRRGEAEPRRVEAASRRSAGVGAPPL